ncbi:MAG: SRPBCC family protein [Anaerolineales bacterium]
MEYKHRFKVEAPLAAVRQFHQRMESFKALTPPPIIVQLHRAPENPGQGDEMEFTLWLGPLPVRWLAEFTQVDQDGFTDLQKHGPFKRWVHHHHFTSQPNGSTVIEDRIEVEIGLGMLTPIAVGMWLGLPLLFLYRQWRTRRALASIVEQQA